MDATQFTAGLNSDDLSFEADLEQEESEFSADLEQEEVTFEAELSAEEETFDAEIESDESEFDANLEDIKLVDTARVRSVNGQTGDVVIHIPSLVSELENDSEYISEDDIESLTNLEIEALLTL